MTEITKYKCDICGMMYGTGKEAMKCELTHIPINRETAGAVKPLYSHAMKYPSWIEVKMADGKTLRYTRIEGL